MHNVVFAFFFLSGFTSLVFEVLWERSLARVFGTTSLALSTLLTAFMAGLALGAWLAGKWAARTKRPLRIYALLEGGVGLYALLVPFLLDQLPAVYGSLFVRLFDEPVAFAALRFVAVFAILVVPTTLMGASLPFMSQWISRSSKRFHGRVGLLYATNTLGACGGSLLAGFVLLPTLGLAATNYAFAALNVLLCLIVLAAEATFLSDEHLAPLEEPSDDLDEAFGRTLTAEPTSRRATQIVVVGFGVAGLVSMTYQVLWTRAYVIVLGSSTYSFTLILSAFLLGLGSGSAVASSFVDRVRRPVAWLAATQLLLVTFATAAFAVLDDLPEVLFARMREQIGSAEEIYLFQFVLVGALVFLPIALQGAAFPLVVRALATRREHAGADVARAYTVNTAGAIGGGFLAGFVLMPLLGLHGAMTLMLTVNLLVALSWVATELRESYAKPKAMLLGVLSVVAAATVAFGPTMDRVALTRGMFRVYWARELFDAKKFASDNPELVFYADGITATTTVEKRGALVTLKANGKPEASDGHDMATQILVALLPMMIRSSDHPVGNENVAMIGFGSGVTAGAALQWPLARLEVVEIEPAMLEASRFFDHVNHRPLSDPRTSIVETDGRNFLEYSREMYDVVISEPSNPWIAGVASLFTVEHFWRARRRLAPGGVFGQWVQLYEISPENVKTIFATFSAVFPHVAAFSSMPKGTDLILIGSEQPIELSPEGFAAAWQNDVVRAELQRAGISSPWDAYGLMFMNGDEIRTFIAGAPLNTDDNGLLEFAAPRDLIRYDVGQKYFQERYFRTDDYGDPVGHLADWPQGWGTEQRAELAIAAWKAGKPGLADRLVGRPRAESLAAISPTDELTPTQTYWSVRHAEDLDLEEAVTRAWPWPNSELHGLVSDAAGGSKHLQAMMYLERDGAPPRHGFVGERGLAYAYVLARRKYFRHAMEQIEGLEQRADPTVTDSVVFHLIAGHIRERRRRYEDAFDDYAAAARLLIE